MKTRRLICTATATLLASTAAQANPLSFDNESGGSVTFYGQASPAYVSFDDGETETGRLVDNTNSNTRAGFRLSQPMNGGTTFGFLFETALGAPASSAFSQDFEPIWEWDKTRLRFIDLTLSGEFGKLSVGQGSMASDGVAGSDLTRTGIAGYVYRPDLVGSYFLRDDDTGDLSAITISDIYNDFDGARRARIRYDTPSFNGLTFAAAWGQEVLKDDDDADYYDLGMFYSGEAGNVTMEGAFGYSWKDDDGTLTEAYAGSFSLLHDPTGLVGQIVAGAQKDGGSYGYIKAGWVGDVWSAGWTALSVDYYSGQDFVTDGSTSESWGVQAVQFFEQANLEAYLGFSDYSYDDDQTDYQSANSTTAGIRWKF